MQQRLLDFKDVKKSPIDLLKEALGPITHDTVSVTALTKIVDKYDYYMRERQLWKKRLKK